MKNKLIIANWKMNGDLSTNEILIRDIIKFSSNVTSTDIVICPPAIYLSQVNYLIEDSSLQLGAQNVCIENKGAFTGEISVDMLNEFNCKYTLVGHSERRTIYLEKEQEIHKKQIVFPYRRSRDEIRIFGSKRSYKKMEHAYQ